LPVCVDRAQGAGIKLIWTHITDRKAKKQRKGK
jgi:hypothetical protein